MQGAFDFGDPAAADDGPHSLFFALLPDDATRQRIADITTHLHRPAAGGRPLRPARYHLTLQYLGQYQRLPPTLPEQAAVAAEAVRVPGFALSLDCAGSFRAHSHIWWLGSRAAPEGLGLLWRELGKSLVRAGVRTQSGSDFTPHVTIVRDASQAMPLTAIEPVVWPVRAVALVRSSGPHHRHSVLGHWPLAAG